MRKRDQSAPESGKSLRGEIWLILDFTKVKTVSTYTNGKSDKVVAPSLAMLRPVAPAPEKHAA